MTKRRNRKLKSKRLREEQIKRERKTRPKGTMVSNNRMLDYKIQQISGYARKGEKGNGCVKKAMQLLRTKYPELFKV